jgi:hypothetical protein
MLEARNNLSAYFSSPSNVKIAVRMAAGTPGHAAITPCRSGASDVRS